MANLHINSVDYTKLLCYTLPPTQHHSFPRNLPSLFTNLTESVSFQELRQAVQLVEQTRHVGLDNERDERMLDQRMTDEVKIMKRELDEEKRKRTEAEERNKCLLEVR